MNPEIREKLNLLAERHEEITRLLADPATGSDPDRLRVLGQEYAQLDDIVQCAEQLSAAEQSLENTRQIDTGEEPELVELVRLELEQQRERIGHLRERLDQLLLPRDPHEDASLYLEIRAGTGGDEAALFAGDLFRMYARHAEQRGWQLEILSAHPGEQGGFREIVARIEGAGAYASLKYESGTHRVQRVPETESQGRIHTSAVTVAVLREPDEIETVDIQDSELRIDTFRASGAGGQHVNKTDSAVRITHLPSGIVVECQDERSQHKNRARALSLLQSRLLDAARSKQDQSRAEERRLQVGSGDRSQRIRTYNFPQGRLTDHRIHLNLYSLQEILDGNLEELTTSLQRAARTDELQPSTLSD